MIMMQRKVRCKYVGEDKYKPEFVPAGKFMPVIAFETQRGTTYHEGNEKTFENLFYHVIDNKGKLVKVASFNCITIIDDQAEVNGGQLIQMMQNLSTMMKVLGEKLCATSSGKSDPEPAGPDQDSAPDNH